jgi:hypothetical protein
VTELLAYIHTIILMCYNKKCSEKGALSGHVIQLSIKTLTSKIRQVNQPHCHNAIPASVKKL